jgi:hypothetical protein
MAKRKSAKKATAAPKTGKKKSDSTSEPFTLVIPPGSTEEHLKILKGIVGVFRGTKYDTSKIKIAHSEKLDPATNQDLQKNGAVAESSCP